MDVELMDVPKGKRSASVATSRASGIARIAFIERRDKRANKVRDDRVHVGDQSKNLHHRRGKALIACLGLHYCYESILCCSQSTQSVQGQLYFHHLKINWTGLQSLPKEGETPSKIWYLGVTSFLLSRQAAFVPLYSFEVLNQTAFKNA